MEKRAVLQLPTVAHPSVRRCNSDVRALKLQGKRLVDNECVTAMPIPHSGKKRARPCTVPLMLRMRPKSSELSPDQLIDVLGNKLRGNGYFTLKNAFTAFDSTKHGYVTRDALYRILCNILNGITRGQFKQLLQRLNMGNKLLFSFHELYGKFKINSPKESNVAERLTCHTLRPLRGDYVHSMLVARAEKCIHQLSDFLPRWKGVDGQLDRTEFRNTLSYLSLPMNNEEFSKLWNRYDPKGKGYITGRELMQHMGVSISSRPTTTTSTLSSTLSDCTSVNEDLIENYDETVTDLIKSISNKLKNKRDMLLDALRYQDHSNSGKVTASQLLLCFRKLEIPISPEQCKHLLVHLGYQQETAIDYLPLVNRLTSISAVSVTNGVLTDSPQQYVDPQRACVSTADAEARLVYALQRDFLHVLSRMKLHDRKCKGYIKRADFVRVLESLAPPTSKEAIETLTNSIQDSDNGLIPYPRFLALFDGPTVTNRPLTSSAAAVHHEHEDMSSLKQKISETKDSLADICKLHPHKVIQAFEDIDTGNTERVTMATLQQILFRIGLNVEQNVVAEVMGGVLKNKDGTINPWELIRQFGHNQSVRKGHLSDDHFLMRSKYLHRDEDMLIKTLEVMIKTNRKALLKFFTQNDPSGCGLVSHDIFLEALLELNPLLTPYELSYFTGNYGDQTTQSINYQALLRSSLSPQQPTYRVGNNMASLLSSPFNQPVDLPLIHQRIATPPQHGLPGMRARLQKKVQQRWSDIKRQLCLLDPAGRGTISVKDFRHVLKQHGIPLRWEDLQAVSHPPLVQDDTINYVSFFNILMCQP